MAGLKVTQIGSVAVDRDGYVLDDRDRVDDKHATHRPRPRLAARLSNAQIGAFSTSAVSALSPEQVGGFTSTELNALSVSQFAALSGRSLARSPARRSTTSPSRASSR